MEEELKIKKRLIDLLNENEKVKSFELLSDEFYEKYKNLNDEYIKKRKDKDYKVSEELIKEVKVEENKISELLAILENQGVINKKSVIGGFENISKSSNFRIFKKNFYVEFILNELFKNKFLKILDHKNTSLGEINSSDIEIFHEQIRGLLNKGIIKGSNREEIFKSRDYNVCLSNPDVLIFDSELQRIMEADVLGVIPKIDKIISENKNSQVNITITGNNNNVVNGDNNTQTVTINESDLMKNLLESTRKIKNEISQDKYEEIVLLLNDIKNSRNKGPLWEKFISLAADISTLSSVFMQEMVPILATFR